MLFYTQIKREFSPVSWRRGQVYFREERVRDVRLEGDTVLGMVQGTTESPYATALQMGRGTISNSKCSCPVHRKREHHCKHVAALAIWVVERGSLLRAGVTAPERGVAVGERELTIGDPQKAASDPVLRRLILSNPLLSGARFQIRRDRMAGSLEGTDKAGYPFSIPITLVEAAALLSHTVHAEEAFGIPEATLGQAILFVRGLFQGRILSGVTVESGIQYRDGNGRLQIATLTFLTRLPEPGHWRTTNGTILRIPTTQEIEDQHASFIQKLEHSKVIYHGQSALENLASLLQHKHRDQIVFDPAVDVKVENIPLKLESLSIGRNTGKSRELAFEFRSGELRLDSAELEELAKLGRLSNHYVWKGDRIYRFETSLTRLRQYANRTGVAEGESDAKSAIASPGAQLADDAENPLHPLAAYRLSLELGVQNFKVAEDWQEYHEWLEVFERKRLPNLPKVKYGFDLRGYQENGLSWLWSLYHRGLSGLLADEMGLGKTHQVLAMLSSIYRSRTKKPDKPSLVVAPTSVIAAWQQKLDRYDTGLKWHVFHGAGRKLPQSGVHLVLTSYGILNREPALRDKHWHIAILDEAQAIKNATTLSSRASRSLKSDFRIAMTGTPIENQATDLWSLMEFLLPGYLGTLPRFKRLYGGWGRETPPEIQAQALKRLISPFLLRRTKSKVLTELPEKTEEVVHCEMTPVQKKAYRAWLTGKEATKARENLESGGKIDYANILALLTRLKQVCDHPKLPEITAGKGKKAVDPLESGKWDAFDELLQEALGSNLKVVVFTQYLGMMDMVGQHLKKQDIGYTEIRGDTPDRGERLIRFSKDPDCRVFVCSLLAGGLGIDLTSASVCIHLDRWWNPARENQATDRLHRMGQTRGVQVFKLQIPGTVEDRIASIIQSKIELSGALIEESAAGLKSFSRKELLELLNPDQVGE